MSAGKRRHRLTLQRRTDALDSFGEETRTYATLTTAWGSLESVNARERFESQQVRAEVSHRIKIPWSPLAATLVAKDRITLGARVFDVVTPVDREGRSKELEILAMEDA